MLARMAKEDGNFRARLEEGPVCIEPPVLHDVM